MAALDGVLLRPPMQKFLCPLLLSLFFTQPACAASADPADTVSAFYKWDIAHSHSAADRSGIKHFITAELACLHKAHERYLRAFAQALPELKPTLVEFDFYSGFVRTPSRFEVIKSRTSGDKAAVQVRLFVAEDGVESNEGALNTVDLRRYQGRWVISDVRYSFKMNMFKESRLLAVLYEDMSHNEPQVDWKVSQLDQCRQKSGPAARS
jgi:hypothetical protein